MVALEVAVVVAVAVVGDAVVSISVTVMGEVWMTVSGGSSVSVMMLVRIVPSSSLVTVMMLGAGGV